MKKRDMSILVFIILLKNGFGQTPGAYLGQLTWPEAEKRILQAPLVILPFAGGAKEHGPHLPMNADRTVMEYLCQKAVDGLPVVVAPPILHGWFPAFREFPGTEVADPNVFQNYVFQVARSLIRCGAKRIVLLNMGIFKATGLPMAIIAREIRVQHGVPTLLISWDDLETEEAGALQEQTAGGHGDEIETSINLYLQSEWVRMDKAVTDYWDNYPVKTYVGYRPGLFSRNPEDPAYSETGHFGDPTLASAEKGKKVLDIMTKNWLDALRGFSMDPIPGG